MQLLLQQTNQSRPNPNKPIVQYQFQHTRINSWVYRIVISRWGRVMAQAM